MLLRRVTNHVQNQNWFAVFIDFLIVVVGVFIGIQVANWNESRIERHLSQDYTKRLIVDLEKDLVETQVIYNYFGIVLENIEVADKLLSLPDSDAKTLILAAYRASEHNDAASSQATWDQIVSSGHLALLPKSAMASGIADYYKLVDYAGASRVLESPYRLAVRSIIPLPVQLAIRSGCSDAVDDTNVVIGFTSNCELEIDSAVLKDTAEQLRSSMAVRQNIRNQYSRIAVVYLNRQGNIVLLKRLIEALKNGENE
jgi:hypothetical protein